jgi:ArsR family transcriptional regulator
MALSVDQSLLPMEILDRVAPVVRIVAHPVRLRILDYLDHAGERTVSEIVSVAGCSQALVSQQLRILKDQGVLAARREGNYVFYEIRNRSVLLLLECIRQNRHHA